MKNCQRAAFSPWLFEHVTSGHEPVPWQFGSSDFFFEDQGHGLAQLVVEEPQCVGLFDVGVEGGAVTALN